MSNAFSGRPPTANGGQPINRSTTHRHGEAAKAEPKGIRPPACHVLPDFAQHKKSLFLPRDFNEIFCKKGK